LLLGLVATLFDSGWLDFTIIVALMIKLIASCRTQPAGPLYPNYTGRHACTVVIRCRSMPGQCE